MSRPPSPARASAWNWRVALAGLIILALALASCRKRAPEPPRVAKARAERGADVRRLCRALGVSYPPRELFLRAFKKEGALECWARSSKTCDFRLLKTFQVTATSGAPGPKRREGDLQVPEGFYTLDRFNPESSFHLSMRVNYPNAADQIRSDQDRPGFDIYIHGGDVSVGCLPIGDDGIEQLYLLTADAAQSGATIPVHIFPARMSGAGWDRYRAEQITAKPDLEPFWHELQPGFDVFEKTHRIPRIEVDAEGRYVVR